ncbi:hypothetical protein M0802_004089 [Mischocyttarus mexicanus]|nr:hypothetical protein M0802_004089 [Mischocyttarus mexicanus]
MGVPYGCTYISMIALCYPVMVKVTADTEKRMQMLPSTKERRAGPIGRTLTRCMGSWLVGWLVGRLVGRLDGLLVGWLHIPGTVQDSLEACNKTIHNKPAALEQQQQQQQQHHHHHHHHHQHQQQQERF